MVGEHNLTALNMMLITVWNETEETEIVKLFAD